MRQTPFVKMSACGNDFILMDHREMPWREWDLGLVAKRICTRRLSVGADGLIVIVPPRDSSNHFGWRFFNSDGSEAEMCGNGARCAARFAHWKGLAPSKMRFETLAGVVEAEVLDQGVRIWLNEPEGLQRDVEIELDGRTLRISTVNTGVPHAVMLVEDVEGIDVEGLGRAIRFHGSFAPSGTNVDFLKVVDKSTVKMRTYERGVESETLACGTGAVACAAVARAHGLTEWPVRVITRSGRPLIVGGDPEKGPQSGVYLEGEARKVYEGLLSEEALQWERME
jgi:diaminopimelate epimerase